MGKDKAFGAVIVETRPLPIGGIIERHMDHLPGFDLMIFGYENEIYRNTFPKAKFINLGCHLDEAGYNQLLTSKMFWEAIPYEKVLIFQHDSMILRDGIEEFLQWDYIGAPWSFPPYVGNGGFSLRSKKAMLATIEKTPYRGAGVHGNEDVYFCNHLVGNLAPLKEAEKFCCESKFKIYTFAYHAIEKYLTPEQCFTIKNQYK